MKCESIPKDFEKFIKDVWNRSNPYAERLRQRYSTVEEAVKGEWEREPQKDTWGRNKAGALLKCDRCNYEWQPRKQNPKKCPRCQNWLPGWRLKK